MRHRPGSQGGPRGQRQCPDSDRRTHRNAAGRQQVRPLDSGTGRIVQARASTPALQSVERGRSSRSHRHARPQAGRSDRPTDAWAVGFLAAHLSDQGASPEVIHTLVDARMLQADQLAPRALALALPNLGRVATDHALRSLAQHAVDTLHSDPEDTCTAIALIRALKAADAFDLLTFFVTRVAIAAPILDPDELPFLIAELWRADAKCTAHSLVSLAPESRIRLTDARLVLNLLEALRAAGADEAAQTLLNRGPARQVRLVSDPDNQRSRAPSVTCSAPSRRAAQ